MTKNKLKTKDLIYAGAFAALYIITLFIVVMGFGMIPLLYIMAPLFVGILGATIYMMYVTKIKKFGAILILALLFGLIMSSSGHGIAVMLCLPIGIVGELIAKIGKFQSKKMFSLSYLVFNLTVVAPFCNLYMATDSFIGECYKYYGQAYGDTIKSILDTYGMGLLFIQIGLAIIGALVGVILSSVLFKKHFQKAGIL